MITKSINNQLRLAENGVISWQKDHTNPLPGDVVGCVEKGENPVTPKVSLNSKAFQFEEEKDLVESFIQNWVNEYVKLGLEPLFRLKAMDISAPAAAQIADKLFNAMGIIPREQIQDLIDAMDETARQTLRSKKVRFGPLLVYLPELKKPAAVRLQALLLSLWQGKNLPAIVPADGIVSFSIEGKDIDKEYYMAIGYPVYGPRAMRVDMLDRVVCAVYDNAKEGKFQAQHQMAEWLGSNIADLYQVLEAMGHRKIEDPVVQQQPTIENVQPSFDQDTETQAPVEITSVGAESIASDSDVKPKQEKPALATFALKKGKASVFKKPYVADDSVPQKNKFRNEDKKSFKTEGKKPYKSSDKKFDKEGLKKNKSFKTQKEPREERERIYRAEVASKPEDSPFAILSQLKIASKDD